MKRKDAASGCAILAPGSTRVSIPDDLVAPAIWMPIGTEGRPRTMMYGDGYGLSR